MSFAVFHSSDSSFRVLSGLPLKPGVKFLNPRSLDDALSLSLAESQLDDHRCNYWLLDGTILEWQPCY